MIRVITSLMERPFLSSRRPCEVILIYKSCLTFRMHHFQYGSRTIILSVFGPYQHLAHQGDETDDWEEPFGLYQSKILLHTSMHLSNRPLSRNESDTFIADVIKHACVLPGNSVLFFKQLFMCGRTSIGCNETHRIWQLCATYVNPSDQNANLESPAECSEEILPVWHMEMSLSCIYSCEH